MFYKLRLLFILISASLMMALAGPAAANTPAHVSSLASQGDAFLAQTPDLSEAGTETPVGVELATAPFDSVESFRAVSAVAISAGAAGPLPPRFRARAPDRPPRLAARA